MRVKGIRAGIIACSFVLGVVLVAHAASFGVKKKRPRPHEYGNVVIDNASSKNDMAPVVFMHWLHRSKYSCRLCHVDIGFAMTGGGTGITENDIKNGMYCGACHDGTTAFAAEEPGPDGTVKKNCDLCHSEGKKVVFKNEFYAFQKKLPRERFGNGIDWMGSEDQNLITVTDFLDSVSIRRPKLQDPEDAELKAKEAGMPDIIFSHKKHAVWSGCELCHPEIFGVKKGGTVYSMEEIFDGRYCGACHGLVAFPNNDCQRCHTKQVY